METISCAWGWNTDGDYFWMHAACKSLDWAVSHHYLILMKLIMKFSLILQSGDWTSSSMCGVFTLAEWSLGPRFSDSMSDRLWTVPSGSNRLRASRWVKHVSPPGVLPPRGGSSGPGVCRADASGRGTHKSAWRDSMSYFKSQSHHQKRQKHAANLWCESRTQQREVWCLDNAESWDL